MGDVEICFEFSNQRKREREGERERDRETRKKFVIRNDSAHVEL